MIKYVSLIALTTLFPDVNQLTASSASESIDFDFISTKGFLADAVTVCAITYEDRNSDQYNDYIKALEKHPYLDADSIKYFGLEDTGGATVNFEKDNISYKIVSFKGSTSTDQWMTYAADAFASFPYIPAAEAIHSEDAKGSMGVNGNFWRHYRATGWCQRSVKKDTPIIFTGHSLGGALADIASWVTVMERGADCLEYNQFLRTKRLSPYAKPKGINPNVFQHIASVTFGQPAVYTEKLAEFMDCYMQSSALKVGFDNDPVFKIMDGLWTVSDKDSHKLRRSLLDSTLSGIVFNGSFPDEDSGKCTTVCDESSRLDLLTRTTYSISGTTVELSAPKVTVELPAPIVEVPLRYKMKKAPVESHKIASYVTHFVGSQKKQKDVQKANLHKNKQGALRDEGKDI